MFWHRPKSRRETARDTMPRHDANSAAKVRWLDDNYELLKDMLFNQPGFKVHSRGGEVQFQIGHQSFVLKFKPEDNAQRAWMVRQLERALMRLEGSRPDEDIDITVDSWLRVRSWAMDGMKLQPERAFAAGPERNVARLLWELKDV